MNDERRDWTEDAAHENGNYYCMCVICKHLFTGHKRRVICRLCAKTPHVEKVSELPLTESPATS